MSISIKCPNCGHNLVVSVPSGRKCYDINFNNISKAIQAGAGSSGILNQSAAARILSEKLGKRITPGFISNRITKEAESRGIERQQLIREILEGRMKGISNKND